MLSEDFRSRCQALLESAWTVALRFKDLPYVLLIKFKSQGFLVQLALEFVQQILKPPCPSDRPHDPLNSLRRQLHRMH